MTDKLISLVIKVCDWVANLKERKMCNCFSTALQIGKDKNVRLITPDYFGTRAVLVDACIAPVIQHLWKHLARSSGNTNLLRHFGIFEMFEYMEEKKWKVKKYSLKHNYQSIETCLLSG